MSMPDEQDPPEPPDSGPDPEEDWDDGPSVVRKNDRGYVETGTGSRERDTTDIGWNDPNAPEAKQPQTEEEKRLAYDGPALPALGDAPAPRKREKPPEPPKPKPKTGPPKSRMSSGQIRPPSEVTGRPEPQGAFTKPPTPPPAPRQVPKISLAPKPQVGTPVSQPRRTESGSFSMPQVTGADSRRSSSFAPPALGSQAIAPPAEVPKRRPAGMISMAEAGLLLVVAVVLAGIGGVFVAKMMEPPIETAQTEDAADDGEATPAGRGLKVRTGLTGEAEAPKIPDTREDQVQEALRKKVEEEEEAEKARRRAAERARKKKEIDYNEDLTEDGKARVHKN